MNYDDVELCLFLKNCDESYLTGGYGDQHIFNKLNDIGVIKIRSIHPKFNIIPCSYKTLVDNSHLQSGDIYIIHYTLTPKPWQHMYKKTFCNHESKELWVLWNKIYIQYLESQNNIKNYNIKSVKYIRNNIIQ